MNAAAVQNAVRGTVKVGRWEYPAVRNDDGSVYRNTDRKTGDGDWVEVTGKAVESFAPDAPDTPGVPEIDGFTEEGHSDYDDLRVAYRKIFDEFGVTYDELADALGHDLARTKAIVAMLRDKGLVVTDKVNNDQLVVQSYKTYDSHTADEVMADFAEAFNPGVKIRRSSGHGGKVGAQHKKPGKSRWEPGSRCPQGHLLREEDIYTMPSGRKQCRKCRHGYVSNTGKAK